MRTIAELVGRTITKVTGDKGEDAFTMTLDNGDTAELYHEQDCCEDVYLEDVVGDPQDLVGTPVLLAEEVSSGRRGGYDYGTHTWTFYKIATVKGEVTLRFYGSSNGYYSEGVDFAINGDRWGK